MAKPKKPKKKKIAPKSKAKRPAKKTVAVKARRAKTPPPKPKRARGLPEELRDAALKILDDRQADEIVAVDLSGKSSMADYLLIASGRASRQIAAIAHYLREAFEKLGARQIRVEGLPEGNWVLVDAGDVVVHLFRPEVRRYYNLESIWKA